MYQLTPIKLLKKLTKANIEKELRDKGYNEYDLAKYYVSNFKGFNVATKSDLRSDDKNNSLQVIINNNKLIISDFGLQTGMSIYDYLMKKYFTDNRTSFVKVLNMIRNDFNLTEIEFLNTNKPNKTITPTKHNKVVKNTSLSSKIEVKRQRNLKNKILWTPKDIAYWKQYGIPTSKLEEKGIAPLSKFWITNYNKNNTRVEYNVINELCYVYPFYRNKDGFFMYKIYLPKGFKGDTNFKWISNINKAVIQNIQCVPKSGELLIIQTSYKDTILTEILNPSLNVIALNAEGIWFTDWHKLRSNWKHIVFFANNDFTKVDNPGLTFALKYCNQYKIPFITTPDNTASDISDYYKFYGKRKTSKFLNECINNIKLIT